MDPRLGKLPPHDHVGTYIGHGGDTYAFLSDAGYYPKLNASITVIVNQVRERERAGRSEMVRGERGEGESRGGEGE